MNIFRILSSNDGSINEPNVSSFLAYLLDPNEDHGISSLLLQELLSDITKINPDFLNKIKFNDRITDLSKYSGYSINIIPELSVNLEKKGKKKRRDIDIIIDRAAVTHNDLPAIKRTILNSFDKLKVGGYFIGIDWFSTKHSDFQLGVQGGDRYTRTNIKEGQFKGVGNVHFSDEEHMRSLFLGFDIISLEEKIINNYELQNNHQFASWNIVARKR